MVLDTSMIMDVVCEVAQDKDLKVSVKSSLMGGAATGGAATLGALIMGPIGLAIGGAIGGLISALCLQGQFKSVVSVIRDMDDKQKDQLAWKVRAILNGVDATDLLSISVFLLHNSNVKELIAKEIVQHLSSSLRMNVIC